MAQGRYTPALFHYGKDVIIRLYLSHFWRIIMKSTIGAATAVAMGILVGSILEISAAEDDIEIPHSITDAMGNDTHEEYEMENTEAGNDENIRITSSEVLVPEDCAVSDLNTFADNSEASEDRNGEIHKLETEVNTQSELAGEVMNDAHSFVEEAEVFSADNSVMAVSRANQVNPASSTDRETASTLNGIDISHWQNGIDLEKIPADFILCKASGGKGYKDPDFTTYADSILNSNRLLGFYHFAQDNGFAGNATEEADFFYSVTRDYVGKGIPVLDWEAAAIKNGPVWAKTFMDRYYSLSGVKCLIYMSASTTRDWNWEEVAEAGYKLWLAQYAYGEGYVQEGYEQNPWTDGKGTGAFDSIQMHQYSSGGKLSGYNGRLDMDIFYGTRQDWIDLCKSTQTQAALYRLYNRITGEHLYTLSAYEREVLKRGDWNYEGIAWQAPAYSGSAVYRMYNRRTGDHHYTTSVFERDSLRKGDWNYEGIAWYSAVEAIPVYRLYNPAFTVGSHHFTTSYYEYQALKQYGWNQEGIAWYGCEEPKSRTLSRNVSQGRTRSSNKSDLQNADDEFDTFKRVILNIPQTQKIPVSDVHLNETTYLEEWTQV